MSDGGEEAMLLESLTKLKGHQADKVNEIVIHRNVLDEVAMIKVHFIYGQVKVRTFKS